MVSYKHLIGVITLYNGHIRRNREPYVLHCIRMAQMAKDYGSGNRVQLLCLLHDVLELNKDVRLEQLRQIFSLESVDLDVLRILTCATDETSEQHFHRILNGKSIYALLVKWFDCYDNSQFVQEDFNFYETHMSEPMLEARLKYINRLRLIEQKLAEYGHPVPSKMG